MNRGYSRFARRAHWHGFGLMAGSGRFFGPGEVRLALLSLLADEPMHGYELMKRLEERSGGVYRASAGTIYPTLQQLEDEGQITSKSLNGKRVYKLTEAGRGELKERDETVRQIWRRARRWEDWRSALPKEAALEIVTASGRNSEYGKKSRAEFAAGMSSARFWTPPREVPVNACDTATEPPLSDLVVDAKSLRNAIQNS
jgi:DNA-binding PadR family transcriptional regulator